MAARFYSALLPLSGHELYFFLPVVQNWSFQFHPDQLQLLSLEHFHSFTLQEVLQKIHDIVMWPFLFRGSHTSWDIYIYIYIYIYIIFFFPSYNYFLSYVICPCQAYISGSLRKTACLGILSLRTHLRLWDTFFELEEYSTGHCTSVRKSHLEGTATNIQVYNSPYFGRMAANCRWLPRNL